MIRALDTNAMGTTALALEPQALGSLRFAAKSDPARSMRVVAQQFESMFMSILMKSMRASTQGGFSDNEQSRLYTELADQQVAQKIATTGKGLGIADMLLAQMNRGAMLAAAAPDGKPIPLHRESAPIPLKTERAAIPFKCTLPGSDMMPLNPGIKPQAGNGTAPSPKAFVAAVWDHAAKAGKELGVAPHALVAQAALESGWGKHEIKLPDGSTSHNVFGIKAGADWQGKTAATTTTEYVNGVPQTRVARFRAYDSYDEAFQDYAHLLKTSPRYANALQAADANQFAAALQRAGYATDPAYATKLSRVMASSTLRQALLA
jgi:flagellar protein FlgJ